MTLESAASNESPRRFWLLVAAIWGLALVIRLHFFAVSRIDDPFRGDVVQYVNYALNIVKHGTFSSAMAPDPVTGLVPPDAFRGPGYPFFLAIWTWLSAGGQNAYPLSVLSQIVMGSLISPLAILWCRRWMPVTVSLLVGTAIAVWPHLVVFSSTLLSETMFAAEIVLFLLLASQAFAGRPAASAWTGLVGGLAYLTNPLFALFPLVVAVMLWWLRNRRAAVVMLGVYMLMVCAWGVRNASHPGMTGAWDRAAINFVQGSWPTYHDAVNLRGGNSAAAAEFAAIVREQELLQRSPAAGLQVVGTRIATDPVRYLNWYAWQKPVLLWSWSIKLGWGDIYFLKTPNSPYERAGPLGSLRDALRWLNPWILVAAVFAVGLAIWRAIAARPWARADLDLILPALLFIYLTAVHTVFQAEPRYAVAYRPLELALAIFAVYFVGAKARARTGAASALAR